MLIIINLKVKKILYKDEKLRKELEAKLGVKIHNEQELGDFVEIDNETLYIKEVTKMLNKC